MKKHFLPTIIYSILLLSVSLSLARAETPTRAQKDWNFIVYIAANNNLHRFSIHNIRQMAKVGSSNNMNIIVQLDGLGQKEVTRYYIEKNNPVVMSSLEHSNATTSGTVESLYKFVKWSVENYPAKHHAIVLWNHGSGIKDPSIWGRMLMAHRDELFHINYSTGLLELNRDMTLQKPIKNSGLLGWVKRELKKRGIAFNDTYETYLTNQDLKKVLNDISSKVLGGKKIDLLCMDACHMAMVEVGSQIKNSVDFMAGSEEVEPGSGYNYTYLLEPFTRGTMTPREFAIHTVKAYQQEYESENADFTQSAVALNNYETLENNIKKMARELEYILTQTESLALKNLLKSIRRNKNLTTSFCDPDYIDFCHFYKSLSAGLESLAGKEHLSSSLQSRIKTIQGLILEGFNCMQNYIIKNASGENLPEAYGLSFYFPLRTVHKSYYSTEFDQTTKWSSFLQQFIKTRDK